MIPKLKNGLQRIRPCISRHFTVRNFAILLLFVSVASYIGLDYFSDIFKAQTKTTTSAPKWIPRKALRPTIKIKPGRIFLLILIMSPPNNLDNRAAIRDTWAKSLKSNETKHDTCLIFVLGSSKSTRLEIEVESEAKEHKDIFRIQYLDNQRNEIAKLWKAYYWVESYEPQYILRTRDDVFVYLPSLKRWLHGRPPKEKLYAGKVVIHAPVIRNRKDARFVSKEEYEEASYPDYCESAFYVFSGDILEKLVRLSSKIGMFHVEDSYFGVLMKQAEVSPLDIRDRLHIDANVPFTVKSWPNRGFADVFCIAYNLQPHLFQLIADRYKSIEHMIEEEAKHA